MLRSEAFKPTGNIQSGDLNTFVRDYMKRAVDTVAEFRLTDMEDQKLVYCAERGASYELNIMSGAADNGDTVIVDGYGRRYEKLAVNISASLPAPYVAASVAEVKSIDTSVQKVAFLNLNKRNAIYRMTPGDFTAMHALDTVGGAFIKANDTPSNTGGWVLQENWLSPKHFDAVGDDGANDNAPLNNWFAVLMASTYGGVIDGKFRSTSALDWNFQPRRTKGVTIIGRSANDDYINVSAAAGSPAFRWHCSSQAMFYGVFRDFGIRTDYAGVGFQVGQDDFADAWNQCQFTNVLVNNGNANSANVALRLNHILHSQMLMTVNGGGSGRPGSGTEPGYGTAVELRQVIACNGVIHAGNATRAHKYTSGYSYGNVLHGTNIEEVDTAIACDSPNAAQNSYVGGNMVSKTLIDSTQGNRNVIENVNVSGYAGFSEGSNLIGWERKDSTAVSHLATPALPASGSWYRNTTTRRGRIVIYGDPVTNIEIKAFDGGIIAVPPQTTNQCPSFLLLPGWEVRLTYTGAPVWLWFPE